MLFGLINRSKTKKPALSRSPCVVIVVFQNGSGSWCSVRLLPGWLMILN